MCILFHFFIGELRRGTCSSEPLAFKSKVWSKGAAPLSSPLSFT